MVCKACTQWACRRSPLIRARSPTYKAQPSTVRIRRPGVMPRRCVACSRLPCTAGDFFTPWRLVSEIGQLQSYRMVNSAMMSGSNSLSPGPLPGSEISTIAFDGGGRMLLAERGAPRGAYDYKMLAPPSAGRVLRLRAKPPGAGGTPFYRRRTATTPPASLPTLPMAMAGLRSATATTPLAISIVPVAADFCGPPASNCARLPIRRWPNAYAPLDTCVQWFARQRLVIGATRECSAAQILFLELRRSRRTAWLDRLARRPRDLAGLFRAALSPDFLAGVSTTADIVRSAMSRCVECVPTTCKPDERYRDGHACTNVHRRGAACAAFVAHGRPDGRTAMRPERVTGTCHRKEDHSLRTEALRFHDDRHQPRVRYL